MSYFEDIKKLQETSPIFNRPLDTYFAFRCRESGSSCNKCAARSSCRSLNSLTIPLPVIEEVLKLHPELLV